MIGRLLRWMRGWARAVADAEELGLVDITATAETPARPAERRASARRVRGGVRAIATRYRMRGASTVCRVY